jgi:hypothetical protein
MAVQSVREDLLIEARLEQSKGGERIRLCSARRKKGKARGVRDRVDLVVHGRDSKIRSKDSYGNESPRRDTEH